MSQASLSRSPAGPDSHPGPHPGPHPGGIAKSKLFKRRGRRSKAWPTMVRPNGAGRDTGLDNAAEQTDGPQLPVTWPAALYLGDIGAHCKVHSFGAPGARITMETPPQVGAVVALKFPFTIYLRGRIAWRNGDVAGIEFDEPARRSARLVEEALLNRPAAAA